MKKHHRKPAWRKIRLPTAPPGRCHGDASKYRRQQQPALDELLDEYDDDEEEEGSMFVRKCKEYCVETFDQMLPIVLGLTLGFFIMAPVFHIAQEKIFPVFSEAWSMAWHLGETARVIKSPTDDVLVEVLKEAGFEVSNINKEGQIKFSSGPWSAMLINEGYRIKLNAGFKGSKVSIEDSNQWNSDYLYTQMYIDHEGDPFLQAYMYLGSDGVSREALIGFCRMYGKSLDNFASDRLKEILTKLFGEEDQDNKGLRAVNGEVSL